ncbi:hypothetical protein CS542_08535 [Pedobacter sp. IW39]|nr:hypothetical protein CS542_08535 [Pedobacter sp. IW39]
MNPVIRDLYQTYTNGLPDYILAQAFNKIYISAFDGEMAILLKPTEERVTDQRCTEPAERNYWR